MLMGSNTVGLELRGQAKILILQKPEALDVWKEPRRPLGVPASSHAMVSPYPSILPVQIPLRILSCETRNARTKPSNAKTGADTYREVSQIPASRDRAAGIAYRTESLGSGVKEPIPVEGEQKPLLLTAEEFHAKLLFEQSDLLADSRR